MDQLVIVARHLQACDDQLREEAEASDSYGISIRGPERDVPVIEAALQDYAVLAKKLYDDSKIAAALTHSYMDVHCSTKKRAQQSEAALRNHLLKKFKKQLWMGGTNPAPELDGRNYGFTWHRTLLGIKEQFPDEYRAYQSQGEYYYRPPGGESWEDKITRLLPFLSEVLIHSRRHQLFITHEELIPWIETILLGHKASPHIVAFMRRRIGNATAVVYWRHHNNLDGFGGGGVSPWTRYATFDGPQRDYSSEPDVLEFCRPPTPNGVVQLEDVRRRRYG